MPGLRGTTAKRKTAGVVVVVGNVSGQRCVVVANDATVKAGAFFEITLKKTIKLNCKKVVRKAKRYLSC